MDRRVPRRRAHLRLSAPRRACAALLLAAPLASCLIPEPKASHSSGEISPSIFDEDHGPAAEPELGVPVAPPPSATSASEVAANNGESSAASAPSESAAAQPAEPAASSTGTGDPQGQSSPTEGQARTQSTPEEPAPAEQDPSAAAQEAGSAPKDPQVAPQGQEPVPEGQEPAPPDLPAPPTVLPAEGANAPALAQAPKEVHDLLQQYYAAFSKRDWEGAAACFWEGATISSIGLRANEDTEPVKVIISPARAFFDALIKQESSLDPVVGNFAGAPLVQRSGDVVHAWCRYEAKYGPENEKMSWRRYDSVVLIKHEEAWKIFSLAQSRSIDVP